MEKELVGFSWIRIYRDYVQNNPVNLSEDEQHRLSYLLQQLQKAPFTAQTHILYNEYRALFCKKTGKQSMDTLMTIIKDVLGKEYDIYYGPFAALVPTKTEGDQYGTWERPSITRLSCGNLFAYFMDVVFQDYEKIIFLQDDDVEKVAQYAHMHVLPPADIMMASAGYDDRGIDEKKIKIMFEQILHNILSQDGVERVILNDKTICLLKTKYVSSQNAWKLFTTLETELAKQLVNVILTDEIIEQLYSSSRIIYNFSKSKNTLFGGTSSEIYVASAPFRKMKPYECLQKFGIDIMEEALEKTYAKIKDHEI